MVSLVENFSIPFMDLSTDACDTCDICLILLISDLMLLAVFDSGSTADNQPL